MEQEEADVIKRVVSETRPGGNGYPYSYNLLRFQGVDRSSCLRNTRCILIIRTSMTVLNYPALLRFSKSLFLSLSFRRFAHCLQRGKKLVKRCAPLFTSSSSPFFLSIIIFRARMFTRGFEFLSKSRRRNVCYR